MKGMPRGVGGKGGATMTITSGDDFEMMNLLLLHQKSAVTTTEDTRSERINLKRGNGSDRTAVTIAAVVTTVKTDTDTGSSASRKRRIVERRTGRGARGTNQTQIVIMRCEEASLQARKSR